jgi:hypothetical protein
MLSPVANARESTSLSDLSTNSQGPAKWSGRTMSVGVIDVGELLKKSSPQMVSRRRFVPVLMARGAIAGFDLWLWPALAMRSPAEPAVLAGSHFDLVIDSPAGRGRSRMDSR